MLEYVMSIQDGKFVRDSTLELELEDQPAPMTRIYRLPEIIDDVHFACPARTLTDQGMSVFDEDVSLHK
jgi:hypothetical protein